MSTVYSAGNAAAEGIISVEPDPYFFPLLERAAAPNGRDGLIWTTVRNELAPRTVGSS